MATRQVTHPFFVSCNVWVSLLTSACLVACSSSSDTPTTTPASTAGQAPQFAQQTRQDAPAPDQIQAVSLVKGLAHPWALAFLPDGRALVTERNGTLRLFNLSAPVSSLPMPIQNVPEVWAKGQGGLLDVAVDPLFSQNRVIYLSYAEAGTNGSAGTAVSRAVLSDDGTALLDVKRIYQQLPKMVSDGHFGSRVVPTNNGLLYITQGERMLFKDQAQNPQSDLGKVVRLRTDGSVPADNPFADGVQARPEIWSMGHRNMQGAALDPTTGLLWTVEHGPKGGDELNQPQAGKNYGWPTITYGTDYDGTPIGVGTAKTGLEQPVYYWDPVIAASGMTFYSGKAFKGWQNNILIGALRGGLVRLVLSQGQVLHEYRYLPDLGRFRDVQVGPDGFVYVVTDADQGEILKLSPAV